MQGPLRSFRSTRRVTSFPRLRALCGCKARRPLALNAPVFLRSCPSFSPTSTRHPGPTTDIPVLEPRNGSWRPARGPSPRPWRSALHTCYLLSVRLVLVKSEVNFHLPTKCFFCISSCSTHLLYLPFYFYLSKSYLILKILAPKSAHLLKTESPVADAWRG